VTSQVHDSNKNEGFIFYLLIIDIDRLLDYLIIQQLSLEKDCSFEIHIRDGWLPDHLGFASSLGQDCSAVTTLATVSGGNNRNLGSSLG
jgi:hypothetical protein